MKKHNTPTTKKSSVLFFKDAIPVPARLYILAVMGVGFAIALHCFSRIAAESSWQWLYLADLTVVTSSFALKIPLVPRKKGSLSISISDFCVFAGLFLFGPHVAVAIALIEGTISSARVRIKRLYKYLFNMAQLAVVTFTVGRLFDQLQGGILWQGQTLDLGLSGLVGKALLCGLLYFTLNSFLVATAVALVSMQSLVVLWKTNFLWASPTNFLNAALAALSALVTPPFGYVFLLAVVPLILCTFYAYRIGLSRKRQPAIC